MTTRSIHSVKNITFNALMIAALVICSQISLPLPGGIPMTLQTFAISLIGFLLSWKNGLLIVGVYLALGFFGFPVFSNFGAGPAKLFGPTGGYLIGFLPMVFLIGISSKWIDRDKLSKYIPISMLSVAALLISHLCGIIWLSYLSNMGFWSTALVGSIPFLFKDIVSVILGYITARTLRRHKIFISN
ncbi:MAG TPA: biotin transporter BioY [Candidatus Eisenbacteria bacterium]|nr:biotin transporter BioY [Candidatus Eisenbacteria bacterium]